MIGCAIGVAKTTVAVIPSATEGGGFTSAMRAGNVRVAGIGDRREFAQSTFDRRAAGPQPHLDVASGLEQCKLLFGDADQHFLLTGACEPDHRLAGRDHLPHLGVHADHDRIVRRAQGRIAGLVAAGSCAGLGLQVSGFGRVERCLAAIQIRLADESLVLQFLEAPVVRALLVAVDLGRASPASAASAASR